MAPHGASKANACATGSSGRQNSHGGQHSHHHSRSSNTHLNSYRQGISWSEGTDFHDHTVDHAGRSSHIGTFIAKMIIGCFKLCHLTWRFVAICITLQCLFGVTILLSVLYVAIKPFSSRTYRRLACHLGASSFLDAVALLMPNVRLCLTGDSDVPSPIGTSVLVCNHVMEGDWWTILMLGRCIGLQGGVKVFLRNDLFGSSSSPTSPMHGAEGHNQHGISSSNRHSTFSSLRKSADSPPNNLHGRFVLPQLDSSTRTASPNLPSVARGAKNALTSSSQRSQSTSSFVERNGPYGHTNTSVPPSHRHSSSPSLNLLGSSSDNASSYRHPASSTFGNKRTFSTSSSSSSPHHGPIVQTLVRYLLKTLLEFPCLSAESGSNYVKDRDGLFHLLRDFAQEERSCPVQFLLFPEGWSASSSSRVVTIDDIKVMQQQQQRQQQQEGTNPRESNGTRSADVIVDENAGPATTTTTSMTTCSTQPDPQNMMMLRRKLLLAKSNEFAKREGRPQLQHLLLPRTTGFNASLESLRASSPVVYDVTIAYHGYDGLVPISLFDLSFGSLWRLTGSQMPEEVHVRIKKYSMEEVLQDAKWLDKIWAEKDSALGHFYQYQQFPLDSKSKRRGFYKACVFDTRWHSLEGSFVSLLRLSFIPTCIPLIFFFSIPIAWACLWLWIWYKLVLMHLMPSLFGSSGRMKIGGRNRNGANSNAEGRCNSNAEGRCSYSKRANGSSSVDTDVYTDDGNSSDRGGETTPYFPATPFATPMVPSNTSFSK